MTAAPGSLALVLASLAVDPSKHGPRERVLYAEVQRLRAELDDLRVWATGAAHHDCLDRADRLTAQVRRVRALHAEIHVDDEGYRSCIHRGGDYPCDTLQALDDLDAPGGYMEFYRRIDAVPAADPPGRPVAPKIKTCGLCGHTMTLAACGDAAVADLHSVTPLCHTDDHSCYRRWIVYGERPGGAVRDV